MLPAHIRNIIKCSVDVFKGQLDRILLTVPDEPKITGYTAQRRAESNSLLDMACDAHTRNMVEVQITYLLELYTYIYVNVSTKCINRM